MNPFVKQNGIVTQVGMITQLIHRDKMIVKDIDREREWGQSPEKKTQQKISAQEDKKERRETGRNSEEAVPETKGDQSSKKKALKVYDRE